MADNSPQDPAATATIQPEGHLEVDDNLDANDSLYHSTIGGSSFLSSLNSSIYNYRYE
ncbi:hypothetical protein BFJ68_g7912, partial [Fusarium oxysporum]